MTIENKGGIAPNLRHLVGDWVFGCDICQEVCPYNSKVSPASWPEFLPQSGVGHNLDLLDLLTIKDDLDFRRRFQKSAVRRPKRRGLLRNALVVLGNHLKNRHEKSEIIVSELRAFASLQDDPMLIEHAAWALGNSTQGAAIDAVQSMALKYADSQIGPQLRKYAECGSTFSLEESGDGTF